MNKTYRIIIITIAAILGIIVVAAIAVSPIAKSYILKHDNELIGRTVELDRLSINIFTGGLRIDSLHIKNADGDGDFLSIDRFRTRLSLPKLLSHKVIIKHATFDGLDLTVTQDGDKFNFDDMMEHFASDTTQSVESADSGESWIVGLYNIGLRNSHLLYRDVQVGSTWDMDHITLDIPDIVLGGSDKTDVGLNLNFIDGGSLKAKMNIDSTENTFAIAMSLEDFSLESLLPYLQQSVNAQSLKGMLSTDLDIHGSTSHIMNLNISGDINLNDIALTDDDKNEIMSLSQAHIGINTIDLQNSLYDFSAITVDGLNGQYEIFADTTTNFSHFIKSPAQNDMPTENTDAQSVEQADTLSQTVTAQSQSSLRIGTLHIGNSRFDYRDNSLPEKFTFTIGDIDVLAENFNPAQMNEVSLHASVQQSGTVELKWIGNFTGISNQNITLGMHNIDLTDFTPYSLQYFGYPLKNGIMTFSSQNIIADNELTGTNKLDIFKCEVGKKAKKLKPEFRIPMRTGIYILKDKEEHIKIDLPISGNIKSPEFSYKKIIMKTLSNLLVKVVTAPVEYFAEVLGLNNEAMSEIELNGLQRDFTTEQYDKLNSLADMIKQKPELKLTLTQNVDFEHLASSQSMKDLKTAYYMSRTGKSADKLEVIDFETIDRMNSRSSSLNSYADSLLALQGETVTGEITAKAKSLYGEQGTTEVSEWMQHCNELIHTMFVTRKQIPAKNIEIIAPPIDSLKLYKGKNRYKITMEMVGGDNSAEMDDTEE